MFLDGICLEPQIDILPVFVGSLEMMLPLPHFHLWVQAAGTELPMAFLGHVAVSLTEQATMFLVHPVVASTDEARAIVGDVTVLSTE